MQPMIIPDMPQTNIPLTKSVRIIPAKSEFTSQATVKRSLRVAAYCRVSTKKDEQHLSYEAQKEFYTDKIMENKEWQYVDIYADKGITGTVATKRPDFMRMIGDCKKGKIDMIITKSVTRFARNTLDSLINVRMLKNMGIGVIFEVESLNTLKMSNEFMLTVHAGMAQSGSETLSANVTWGHQRSFEKGNVHISFKSFLGYIKGADGKIEIDPEQAVIVRRIYNDFLMGFTLREIAESLTFCGFTTPMGREVWTPEGVQSILRNEKYSGDALLGKTYVEDCLTHKSVVNNGERPQYYVTDSHPAIIDKATWRRVREELARRGSKRKVKEIGTKTEQGKYSGKYALTELLFCSECGTPYRRCTWSKNGKKKAVWRCISRLDHGKKYCKESPTLEENILHEAILEAVAKFATTNVSAMNSLKQHIGVGLSGESEGDPYAMMARIGEIDKALGDLYELASKPDYEDGYESQFEVLYAERRTLGEKIAEIKTAREHASAEQSRLDDLFTIVGGIRNHPLDWDERLIWQMVECIKPISKEKLAIRFRHGIEMEAKMG